MGAAAGAGATRASTDDGGGEMAMTRREFVQYLALLAAGASALPKQIAAFEQVYEINTKPFGETGLLNIVDLVVGFAGQPQDETLSITFDRGKQQILTFALNRRGHFRWAALPQAPIVTSEQDFRWRVKSHAPDYGFQDHQQQARQDFRCGITAIDQEGLVHALTVNGEKTRLTDYDAWTSFRVGA